MVTLDVPRADVKNYGIVVADTDGRIRSFQEKPDPADACPRRPAPASTSSSRRCSSASRPAGYDIGSQTVPATRRGRTAVLRAKPLLQLDRHRPRERLLVGAAARAARRGGGTQHARPRGPTRRGWGWNTSIAGIRHDPGPVYIGASVRIEPGVRIIGPAWIGHGSTLRQGAMVTRSILFNTRASAPACGSTR